MRCIQEILSHSLKAWEKNPAIDKTASDFDNASQRVIKK